MDMCTDIYNEMAIMKSLLGSDPCQFCYRNLQFMDLIYGNEIFKLINAQTV